MPRSGSRAFASTCICRTRPARSSLARAVLVIHSFSPRCLLPFNAAMTEILTFRNQPTAAGRQSVTRVCSDLGLSVITSASSLQGGLTRRLPAPIRNAGASLATVAQKSLQFARSAPGVAAALVGSADQGTRAREPRTGSRMPLGARGYVRVAEDFLDQPHSPG